MRGPLTLQTIIERLPDFGSRPAAGLRGDLGLRWWSYERLYDGAYRAGALLQRLGVGKGDRILIRGQNSPEWVAFFLGAMLRGAVAVPLDFDSPPELVARIAALVNPKVLVSSEEESSELIPCIGFRTLYESDDTRCAVMAVDPSDPAVIFYTSGTTSAPRGVVLTHANILAQTAAFRRWGLPLRFVSVRMLVMAPFSHAQGFVLGIAIPLSLGLSAIYTHLTHPGHLVRLLRDNRVLLFSTVPRVLHMLALHLQSQAYCGKGPETLGEKLRRARRWIVKRHYAFTHLRAELGYSFWAVLVGGAPLPAEDEFFWRVSGCLLIQGYGLTETTAVVSVNFPLLGGFGSVGKPLGDQEVRLADDGEILVRGPNVMPSYYGESESADAFESGFLRTGDIGRVDARNRLFVIGRKKEAIVTGEGFTVHGVDIEEVLNRIEGVEDSVVFGRDRNGHSQVHAALLLSSGTDAAAIVSRANQTLLAQQRIQSWTIWPDADFPRTTLLKPRRKVIADRIAAPETQTAIPRAESLEDVVRISDAQKRLAGIARYIAHPRAHDDDAQSLSLVRDLGLSSLDVVELLALLERQSKRELDRIPITETTTVSELQRLVRSDSDEAPIGIHAPASPRWPELRPLQLLRRVMNPPILGTMVRMRTRLQVRGLEHLQGLEAPVVFAGAGHHHGFDALLVYAALPPRLRRRLAVVTSRWVFTHYLEPTPKTKLRDRFLVGLGFRFLVPMFFPNVLSDRFTRSRESLMDACRLIDRGHSLVAFEGKGVGIVARQCGVPIVPVRLGTSSSTGFMPRARRAVVSVTFERPLIPDPRMPEEELTESLDRLFQR